MATFAQDTFSDSNNTNLNVHTCDSGGTWIRFPQSPAAPGSVYTGRARGGATQSFWICTDQAAGSNYSVLVDLYYVGAGSINYVGLLGRASSVTADCYTAWRTATGFNLGKFVSGSYSDIDTFVARTYENCRMELRMFGDDISLYVIEDASGEYVKPDGTTQVAEIAVMSATDATFSGVTGHGGMQLNNSGITTRVHLDNFLGTENASYTESVSDSFSLSGAAASLAARRPLYLKGGKRIARLPDGEILNGIPSLGFLAVTLTDVDDATYYYYGGLDENNDWQINRYLKTSLTTKTLAIESPSNTGYVSLSAAWAARGSLVYV